MAEMHLHSPRDPVPVVLGPSHPCPYLDRRVARFAYATSLPHGQSGFSKLLDSGFRRSGLFVYRTACDACRECTPLRIPVADFKPDRSQRRTLVKNDDLEVSVGPARFDVERAHLYARYLSARHDGQMSSRPDELEDGLYKSPVETVELTARLDEKLVAVGIIDVESNLLSLVYSAWDPALANRSLGTAFVLWSVALAQRLGHAWVHLGYWVPESQHMSYKARFRPHEVLQPNGRWRRVE